MRTDDRERKKAWKAAERDAARTAFPLSDAKLREMFDHVAEKLEAESCDHTRRFTTAWLDSRQVDAAAVVAWLDNTGGFCDCEVVNNSRDHWESNR